MNYWDILNGLSDLVDKLGESTANVFVNIIERVDLVARQRRIKWLKEQLDNLRPGDIIQVKTENCAAIKIFPENQLVHYPRMVNHDVCLLVLGIVWPEIKTGLYEHQESVRIVVLYDSVKYLFYVSVGDVFGKLGFVRLT